jgi:hypothetical protein
VIFANVAASVALRAVQRAARARDLPYVYAVKNAVVMVDFTVPDFILVVF